jgi:two-component system sensor histidine kinase MtrB
VFVMVAALSAGFVAVTSYLLVREYRHRTFADQATRRVELAMLALPSTFDDSDDALLEAQRDRGGFETVTVSGDQMHSSSSSLTASAVPASLRSDVTDSTPPATTRVDGTAYLVVARPSDDGRSMIFFFFPKTDINESIEQLRNVLAGVWLVTVAISALVGSTIARGALRPVRRAAEESRATAIRLLGRPPSDGEDEFGQWADAFDAVVAALEAKIVELSEAAERERRFTADVAHELRTPLTGIVSAASLLEEHIDELEHTTRRPAELLVGDVRRLHALVIELLEMARLDAGIDFIERDVVDLGVTLDSALQQFAGQAEIECDFEPEVTVWSDGIRLKRIVVNLVQNALKHGGPHVRVRTRIEGNDVRIDVIDSGPGIVETDATRVFERFYKADASRSRQGSGLGLAIAAGHARAIGAALRVSNPGEAGACFTLIVPRAPQREVAPTASGAVHSGAISHGTVT